MVTASHMPFNRNGLKFFTKDGGLDKPHVKAILADAAMLCASDGLSAGEARGTWAHVGVVELGVDWVRGLGGRNRGGSWPPKRRGAVLSRCSSTYAGLEQQNRWVRVCSCIARSRLSENGHIGPRLAV